MDYVSRRLILLDTNFGIHSVWIRDLEIPSVLETKLVSTFHSFRLNALSHEIRAVSITDAAFAKSLTYRPRCQCQVIWETQIIIKDLTEDELSSLV